MSKQETEGIRNWYAIHTYAGYENAVATWFCLILIRLFKSPPAINEACVVILSIGRIRVLASNTISSAAIISENRTGLINDLKRPFTLV